MVGLLNLGPAALVAAACFSSVFAHPDHKDPALLRRALDTQSFHTAKGARAIQACSGSAELIELQRAAALRRAATAQRLREERGLTDTPIRHRRDIADVEKWEMVDHDRTHDHYPHYSLHTPPHILFGAHRSCILTPEGATGPYFVAQELIRSHIVEHQPGVPLHLDLQFIDIETCRPTNLLVDTWSANSTGQYSGISDPAEYSGLNTTWLRGVQKTDRHGVVQFDTIFPGHYANRATHIHILTHTGGHILPNRTYIGGHVSHIGQTYFDEKLRSAVEATYPYNTNTLPTMANKDDIWIGPSATEDVDPFFDYVMLGPRIEDGILAWMSMGVNTSSNWDYWAAPAAYWSENGGYDNPDGGWPPRNPPPASTEATSEDEEDSN